MSAPDNSWEADIRYEVEQHEFDYDPQAWEAMEELLDQAGGGTSSPPSNGKGPLWGPTGLWLLLIGLVMILLYIFWPTNTSPVLGSFSIAPSVKQEIVEITPPTPVQEMETTAPVQPKPAAVTMEPAPEENLAQETTPSEEISEPLRPPVIPLQPLTASNEIPLLKTPDLPTIFEWKPPLSTRRRRNRKTLFPDIIPTY